MVPNFEKCQDHKYLHTQKSSVWFILYHMPLVRKDMDNLDSPGFTYYKSFPTVAIKTSPNITTYHQFNHDVRVRYKQCITRKLCILALMLKRLFRRVVKVRPTSAVRPPNHAERPPKCRTAEITCTISKLHALPPKLAGKMCTYIDRKLNAPF